MVWIAITTRCRILLFPFKHDLILTLKPEMTSRITWKHFTLQDYNNILSNKRCILLLTHATDALRNNNLTSYLEEIQGDPLYDLIMKDMEGWRVMAINNNCDTEYEADKQHEMIVNLLRNAYKEAHFNKDCCNIDFSAFAVPGCNALTKRSSTMVVVLPLVAASAILIWYYTSG